MKSLLSLLALLVALDASAAAPPAKKATPHPSLVPVQDVAGLPRVLLIGDSISMGYTAPVTEYLRGKANVIRPLANCQHTAYGLANIKGWLGTGKWDVIHFNWGIWDTHYLNKATGALIKDENNLDPNNVRVRHTPEEYRKNLTELVKTLKGTGATLIWANTTPITYRKGDRLNTIPEYNEVAASVMKENGIQIDDLAGFVAPHLAQWLSGDQVHFNALGSKNLGEQVGKTILDALQAGRAKNDKQ